MKRSCCEGISHIPIIRESLPSSDDIIKMTYIFKALSDPIRVKILFALREYEICVGEMSNLLEISQSHVSHQLKILRRYGIVDFNKDKKMSFYHIKDDHTNELLEIALGTIKKV